VSKCPSEEATKWPVYHALQKAYRSNLAPGAQQHNDAIIYSKLGSRHLVVTPTSDITSVSNVQWRTLFNFCFSIPIPGLRTRGVCISCGTVPLRSLNTKTHALHCNSQKRMGPTVRHDLALLVIDDFLTTVGVPHTNEPQRFRHNNSNTKSDKIYRLPGQPEVVDMTIHSPAAHSQAGKLNNYSTTLKAADTQKITNTMHYPLKWATNSFLSITNFLRRCRLTFGVFLVLYANASEQLDGQNYEQALPLLKNNLTMTSQCRNPTALTKNLLTTSNKMVR
jgi:hypothetical protein